MSGVTVAGELGRDASDTARALRCWKCGYPVGRSLSEATRVWLADRLSDAGIKADPGAKCPECGFLALHSWSRVMGHTTHALALSDAALIRALAPMSWSVLGTALIVPGWVAAWMLFEVTMLLSGYAGIVASVVTGVTLILIAAEHVLWWVFLSRAGPGLPPHVRPWWRLCFAMHMVAVLASLVLLTLMILRDVGLRLPYVTHAMFDVIAVVVQAAVWFRAAQLVIITRPLVEALAMRRSGKAAGVLKACVVLLLAACVLIGVGMLLMSLNSFSEDGGMILIILSQFLLYPAALVAAITLWRTKRRLKRSLASSN